MLDSDGGGAGAMPTLRCASWAGLLGHPNTIPTTPANMHVGLLCKPERHYTNHTCILSFLPSLTYLEQTARLSKDNHLLSHAHGTTQIPQLDVDLTRTGPGKQALSTKIVHQTETSCYLWL